MLFILFLIVMFVMYYNCSNYSTNEGFTQQKMTKTKDDLLVSDTYPAIDKNGISNNSANDIWWHYPIFKVGSYNQITNNIKYPNNPDEEVVEAFDIEV